MANLDRSRFTVESDSYPFSDFVMAGHRHLDQGAVERNVAEAGLHHTFRGPAEQASRLGHISFDLKIERQLMAGQKAVDPMGS